MITLHPNEATNRSSPSPSQLTRSIVLTTFSSVPAFLSFRSPPVSPAAIESVNTPYHRTSKVAQDCLTHPESHIGTSQTTRIPKMARPYLGLLITGLTSFLFFYLGQAHLTAEFTPDLARKIEGWSVGCSEAWWWFALDAESVSSSSPRFSMLPSPLLSPLSFGTLFIEPCRRTSCLRSGPLNR
jgi:hypothetical protein